MSYKKSTLVAAMLGMSMAATPAFAGEFDGKYQFEYQVVGTAGVFCPTVKTRELPCAFIEADMRLYDGQFTEDSLQGAADQMVGDIEASTGRDVSEQLEAEIDAAVAELFASVGDELNAAINFMPKRLDVFSPWYSETALNGMMMDSNGKEYPVFGSVNLETGDYLLNGLFHGYFDRNSEYRGQGMAEIPVMTTIEQGEISISLEGSGFAAYDSWQIQDEPPPPPTDEPPADEPAPDPDPQPEVRMGRF